MVPQRPVEGERQKHADAGHQRRHLGGWA
jgi:hypothetical protein